MVSAFEEIERQSKQNKLQKGARPFTIKNPTSNINENPVLHALSKKANLTETEAPTSNRHRFRYYLDSQDPQLDRVTPSGLRIVKQIQRFR